MSSKIQGKRGANRLFANGEPLDGHVVPNESVSGGELPAVINSFDVHRISKEFDYELNCVWQRGHGSNRSNKFVDVTKAATFDENAYWEELRIKDEIDEMNDRNREIDEMVDFYERLEKEREQKKRHAQIAKDMERS